MALFQKNPPVPFNWAGGFLFLFLVIGVVLPVRGSEFSLPPKAQLQQESVWKNYQFKLLISPPQALILAPVEIYVMGQRFESQSPFMGSLRLGVEKISPSRGALQETEIGPDDQEEAGWWRVTQIFREPGQYAVRVTLTDAEGEISVLQGKINISSPSRHWKKILLYGLGGSILLITIFFPIRRAWGKSKTHA